MCPVFSGLSARVFPEPQSHGGNHVLHLLLTFWSSVFFLFVCGFPGCTFSVFVGLPRYSGLFVWSSGVFWGTLWHRETPAGRAEAAFSQNQSFEASAIPERQNTSFKVFSVLLKRRFFNPCFFRWSAEHVLNLTVFCIRSQCRRFLFQSCTQDVPVALTLTMTHHFNATRANVSCATAQTGIIVVSCCFDLGCETVELFGAVA